MDEDLLTPESLNDTPANFEALTPEQKGEAFELYLKRQRNELFTPEDVKERVKKFKERIDQLQTYTENKINNISAWLTELNRINEELDLALDLTDTRDIARLENSVLQEIILKYDIEYQSDPATIEKDIHNVANQARKIKAKKNAEAQASGATGGKYRVISDSKTQGGA
jgi:hypothetical protein